MVQMHRLIVSEPFSSPYYLICRFVDKSIVELRQNTARKKELHSNPRERTREGQGQSDQGRHGRSSH